MFFLCWNNFHLLEETVIGRGTTYLTYGIIQEIYNNLPNIQHDISLEIKKDP